MTSITVDEFFVWGFASDGNIFCMPAQSKSDWRIVDNPYKVVKLSAGRGEVWGITANNKVYRMNSSGIGKWQYVNEGFKEVSVGVDNVWLLDTKGIPHKYEIYGFDTKSVFN